MLSNADITKLIEERCRRSQSSNPALEPRLFGDAAGAASA
jgi:hypothetical protein